MDDNPFPHWLKLDEYGLPQDVRNSITRARAIDHEHLKIDFVSGITGSARTEGRLQDGLPSAELTVLIGGLKIVDRVEALPVEASSRVLDATLVDATVR